MLLNNLKKFRTDMGLTQEELAQMMGISQSEISAYERGTRNPGGIKLIELGKTLGCKVDELVAKVDEKGGEG